MTSRRTFVQTVSASAAASTLAQSAALAAAPPSKLDVRLGGPIFLKTDDPVELAKEHRRLGYRSAYVPGGVTAKDTDKVRAIEKAFAAEDVVIAEVGAWKNMLDPDPAARKANMEYVTDRMALAEAVGARCCVDIAGSFHPKVWYAPHPKNLSKEFFDATVENARKVIDAVKPKRAKFALEMMGWSIPHTANSYLQLRKAIDRGDAFGIHIDVCNLVNSPEKIYTNAEFTEEIFRTLGKFVVSCHAKDLAWVHEMNVHFVEVIPGRGEMDYSAYLRGIAKYCPGTPLLLEHLKTAEEYAEGAAHIKSVAAKSGISLA